MIKILILNAPNLSIKDYYAAPDKDIQIQEDHATMPGIFALVPVGSQQDESGHVTAFYNPDCVRAIRALVKPGQYDWIVNGYDPAPYEPTLGETGGYTDPFQDVYLGTWYSTVRVDGHESLYATHEFVHFCTHKLDRLGIQVQDIMDLTPVEQPDGSIKMIPYYLNEQPENPDSNYNRQWKIIDPHKAHLTDKVPLLKFGQSNFWVGMYQLQLQSLGYSLPATAYFGPLTLAATKDIQSKNNLTVDGLVGPLTLYHSVLR